MKNNKQLLNERNMIFFKMLEKRCEGVYALINREEKIRKANMWCKYLDKRYEELNNKIQFNSDILASTINKN